MVGELIVQHLAKSSDQTISISRHPPPGQAYGDLTKPETLLFDDVGTIFCAANPRTFAEALPALLKSAPCRIVVISSTSVFTKLDSSDADERHSIEDLVSAERRIVNLCQQAGTAWTILRPTLIYREGRDRNVTQIARLVERLGVMPLYGAANGRRQPVHAEDLALGAIAAARSPVAINRAYCAPGLETITYREMTGRIFDALHRPRRFAPLPPPVWRAAFSLAKPLYPHITPAMGERMVIDLAFDASEACTDFGWQSRPFKPAFEVASLRN